MAVADRHDFAAFAASSRTDSRAPFFAELKLASMNDSLRSSLPRSRKSSASFCSSGEQSGTLPVLETTMTGLIGRIATRQIVPRSTGAQDPEHTVQHRARVVPRSTSPIVPPLRTKQRFEHRPLGVGEVHALDLRSFPISFNAQWLESVYEITSRQILASGLQIQVGPALKARRTEALVPEQRSK